eukprot:scaffold17554_cov27-Attheya_sp.AAC.1
MKQSRIKDSSNKKERGVTRNEHNFFVSKKQQEEEEEMDLTNVLLESVSHGHRITRDTIEEGFQWGDFLDTPPAQQTSPPTRTIDSPPPIVTRSSIQLSKCDPIAEENSSDDSDVTVLDDAKDMSTKPKRQVDPSKKQQPINLKPCR